MINLLWVSGSFITAFICGAVVLLVIEVTIIYFLFFRNTTNHPHLTSTPSVDGYTFPQQLLELISEKLGENTSEGTVLLNLLLQFWFRENRYDVNTLTSIADRINSELTELLTNTSLGRIFSSLKIHDVELGSESPTISCVSLQKFDVRKEFSTLNNFVFEFDISYVGGFYMAIDAVMKFNSNAAFVSVKVVKCVGRVRVEFTRIPYTYWCMSFINPPELELTVESKLEGHSVPQLNRIIGIQLRRRINRKFVMPYYKIRSKPFLPTHNLATFKDNINESIPNGKLHITILTVSRIAKQEGTISCTVIMDNSPWIEDVQSTNNQMYILQIFRRSNKDVNNAENRKLSTGSIWFDKHQDGLRQRLKSMTVLDESSNIDDIFRRKSFADSGSSSHKLSADNINQVENDELNIQQTKRLPYSELITYNEHFKFNIGPSTRYANILVWNHSEDGQLFENVVGYISVPLVNLISPGIGKKRRIFHLNPPGPARNHAYQSLSTHPGFNHNLCYGDITIGVRFGSSFALSPTLSSNESTPVSLSPTKSVKQPPILLETTASLSDIDSELILSVHEFEKIIINTKQTKCEFCQKKIWLKEASQCSKCHLICHKKCVAKCEKTSECRITTTDLTSLDDDGIEIASQAININPEIITTAPDCGSPNPIISKNKISTFLANVKGIRRSGSASSLTPPSGTDVSANQAHSLPQTPNHSPSPSRKSSVFAADDLKLFEDEEEDDELEKALDYLLNVPKNEQFLESIKNSGKKLCMDLSPKRRELRINEMITKIKAAIDVENETYKELQEKKKNAENDHEAAKLVLLVAKSEDRLQALTNLLLHCCSGLQDSQDTARTPI
ncbi:PDZ domain-containing protein 8 [Planococcus citri]|uniref:PDZ domain-containing protein 8 n=1 Tax=Planococcus citri TaxID=170843 RepID=UPI0031F84B12